MVKVREIYAPFEGATKGGQSMVAIEWCGRMVGGCVPLHREQSRVTVCVGEDSRGAPSGGGTHGPVIISTGRSQEIHFTRSNSFLEDKEVSSQGLAGPRAWGGVNKPLCECLRPQDRVLWFPTSCRPRNRTSTSVPALVKPPLEEGHTGH